MVAELLRLRLQTIGNTVRFGPRRLTIAVGSVLAVLVVTIAVASLVSGLRDAPLDDVRAVVVGGGALLLVGFAVVPFATVRPAWSDPRRLAVLGVPEGRASVGLALGSLVGLPTLALLVLSTGYVRAWAEGSGVAAVAVFAALVAGLTALLLALVASTLNSVVLTSRRGRELALVGAER